MDVPAILRKPTEYEQSLLGQLLQKPFPGREELRGQMVNCLVTPIEPTGSLKIVVSSPLPAPVRFRVPVEGIAEDIDHVMIHYLPNVIDGKADELEIFKEDGSAVLRKQNPSELEVITLG